MGVIVPVYVERRPENEIQIRRAGIARVEKPSRTDDAPGIASFLAG